MPGSHWTFLTNHGSVFIYVARHPDVTVRELADALHVSDRTVASALADLKRDGYLSVTKVGNRNRYTLNPALPLRRDVHHNLLAEDLLALASDRERTWAEENEHLIGRQEEPPTPFA